MKKDIHPKYVDATITCACGEVIHTRSTKKEIKVGVCSKCHPFFTGTQKYVDTAGRVEKFIKKYAGVKPAKKKIRTRKGETTVPVAAASEAPAGVAAETPTAPEVEAHPSLRDGEVTAETPAQEATTPPPAENTARTPAEEAAPAPAEVAAEKPVEEAAPAPAENTAEAPVEEAAPVPAEAAAETPVKEEAPAPSEVAAETPAEEESPAPEGVTAETQRAHPKGAPSGEEETPAPEATEPKAVQPPEGTGGEEAPPPDSGAEAKE